MWTGQNRDAYALGWWDAARGLWPQTVFGKALFMSILMLAGPMTLPWAAPMITGLCLAIPFAVFTASPAFGRWAQRVGLCAIPDEIAPPETLRRLAAGPNVPLPQAA